MLESLARWQTYYPLAVVEPEILATLASIPRAAFLPQDVRHRAHWGRCRTFYPLQCSAQAKGIYNG